MSNLLFMLVLYILIYVFITLVLTLAGIEKQNQGIQFFFISLLLTPIVGILYLFYERKNVSKVRHYHCSECDYIFPEKMRNCPICAEKGEKVRLTKYVSPYKFPKKIKSVHFAWQPILTGNVFCVLFSDNSSLSIYSFLKFLLYQFFWFYNNNNYWV